MSRENVFEMSDDDSSENINEAIDLESTELSITNSSLQTLDFSQFHNLQSIYLDNCQNLEIIDFSNCDNLSKIQFNSISPKSLILPLGLKSIVLTDFSYSEINFSRHSSLEEIDIFDSSFDGLSGFPASLKKISLGKIKGIASLDFSNCSNLQEIVIEDLKIGSLTLKSGNELFLKNCQELTRLDLLSSFANVELQNCSNLIITNLAPTIIHFNLSAIAIKEFSPHIRANIEILKSAGCQIVYPDNFQNASYDFGFKSKPKAKAMQVLPSLGVALNQATTELQMMEIKEESPRKRRSISSDDLESDHTPNPNNVQVGSMFSVNSDSKKR